MTISLDCEKFLAANSQIVFCSFRVNRTYVSLLNFRQILSALKLHLPKNQIDALAAKYSDDDGFNYARFLSDLEPPTERAVDKDYPAALSEVFSDNANPEDGKSTFYDVTGLLEKIKREVR